MVVDELPAALTIDDDDSTFYQLVQINESKTPTWQELYIIVYSHLLPSIFGRYLPGKTPFCAGRDVLELTPDVR
jgi:hypothetical protein